MHVDLGELRDLFRGLQAFEAFVEAGGTDIILAPSGIEWALWDVQYLYEARRSLSPRQQQAIELCLYSNIKESDAAVLMGIGENNPVCTYANNGLKKIIILIETGQLPQFSLSTEAA